MNPRQDKSKVLRVAKSVRVRDARECQTSYLRYQSTFVVPRKPWFTTPWQHKEVPNELFDMLLVPILPNLYL